MLKYGWDKAWCDKKDVIDYASFLLTQKTPIANALISFFASANFNEDETVKTCLNKLIDQKRLKDEFIKDKWKLFFLIEAKEMTCTEEAKVEYLQLIYTEFDYSEDLKGLSIYSDETVSPITTMNAIIKEMLVHKFMPLHE